MVNYATPQSEKSARAMGVALPISFKQTVEVCREIRGRSLASALRLLDDVKEQRTPLRMRKYVHGGIGHRAGFGVARYPIKTVTEVVRMLLSAKANAQQHGLNTDALLIKAAIAKKGTVSLHYGRQSRRAMKRTHLEIVLEENEAATKKKADSKKKDGKKAAPLAPATAAPAAAPVAPATTQSDAGTTQAVPATTQSEPVTASADKEELQKKQEKEAVVNAEEKTTEKKQETKEQSQEAKSQ